VKKYALLVQLFVVGIVSLLCEPVAAENVVKPAISIIIDDIGYRSQEDLRAIGLPGKVAVAIMPHSPYARQMAALANELDKDIL